MQPWEIELVEKMSKEDQKKYYEKTVKKYKEEMKKLKGLKREENREAFASIGWRTLLIASAIAIFAGPALMALGSGAVKMAGEIVGVGGVLGTVGALVGSIIVNDDGPKDIKAHIVAAQEHQKSINNLKNEIKKIKQKPAMASR